jgi:hypothetical protein
MKLGAATIEVEDLAEEGVDTATIPTMPNGPRRYTPHLTLLLLWLLTNPLPNNPLTLM